MFLNADIRYQLVSLLILYFVTYIYIFKVKLQMITYMSLQICLHMYVTRRRVALI